jgi:hypothetical protein
MNRFILVIEPSMPLSYLLILEAKHIDCQMEIGLENNIDNIISHPNFNAKYYSAFIQFNDFLIDERILYKYYTLKIYRISFSIQRYFILSVTTIISDAQGAVGVGLYHSLKIFFRKKSQRGDQNKIYPPQFQFF